MRITKHWLKKIHYKKTKSAQYFTFFCTLIMSVVLHGLDETNRFGYNFSSERVPITYTHKTTF